MGTRWWTNALSYVYVYTRARMSQWRWPVDNLIYYRSRTLRVSIFIYLSRACSFFTYILFFDISFVSVFASSSKTIEIRSAWFIIRGEEWSAHERDPSKTMINEFHRFIIVFGHVLVLKHLIEIAAIVRRSNIKIFQNGPILIKRKISCLTSETRSRIKNEATFVYAYFYVAN